MEILRQAGGVHIQAVTGVRPTICNTKVIIWEQYCYLFIYLFIKKFWLLSQHAQFPGPGMEPMPYL